MAELRRRPYIEKLMGLVGNGKADILIGPKGSGKSTVLRFLADELSRVHGRDRVLFVDMREHNDMKELLSCAPSTVEDFIMAEAPENPLWESMAAECLSEGRNVWLSVSDEEDIRSCTLLGGDLMEKVFLRPVSPSEWYGEAPHEEYPGALYPVECSGSFDGLSWFEEHILPDLERRHPGLPYMSEVFLLIGEKGASVGRLSGLVGRFNRFMQLPKKEKLSIDDMKRYIDVLIDAYLIVPVGSGPDPGRYGGSWGVPFISLIGDVRGGEMTGEGDFLDELWRISFSEGLSCIMAPDGAVIVKKDGKRKSISWREYDIEELPYLFLS